MATEEMTEKGVENKEPEYIPVVPGVMSSGAEKTEDETPRAPTEEEWRSEQEERARASGWRPLEEWDGDPKDWVDAPEFNVRGELMTRISSQTRQLRQMQQQQKELMESLKVLAEHNKKLAKREQKEAIRAIRREIRLAEAEDDDDRVEALEEELDNLRELDLDAVEGTKQEDSKAEETSVDPEAQRMLEEWVSKNDWYLKDPVMHGAANVIAAQVRAENPDMAPQEVFAEIEKKIKEEFPHKFGKGRKAGAGGLSQSSTGDSSGNRKTSSTRLAGRMNDEQKRIGQRFVSLGLYDNLEEYAKELEALGEI